MNNLEFYEMCLNILIERKSKDITVKQLNMYLNGDNIKVNRMSHVLERVCITAQNYGGMKNYIGYFTRNAFSIKKTLFDFDIERSIREYSDTKTLYNTFINNGCDMKNSQNSWIKYSKAIVNALKWLSNFNDFDHFDSYVSSFNDREIELVKELTNLNDKFLGFALTCDFLKELGYKNYSKPDTHIEAIINAKVCHDMGISKEIKVLTQEGLFLEMKRIAKDCNVTPYHLDKLIWTLCSGEFHHPLNYRFNTVKKEIINRIFD